ncbi:5408_t:CDS:2, partial [Acaulospora morrowiae]
KSQKSAKKSESRHDGGNLKKEEKRNNEIIDHNEINLAEIKEYSQSKMAVQEITDKKEVKSETKRYIKHGNRKIINTLLSSMSLKERSELLGANFLLPPLPTTPSIFDYASYIKHLDYYSMVVSIEEWLNETYCLNLETKKSETDYSGFEAKEENRNISESNNVKEKMPISELVYTTMRALFTMFKDHGARLTSLSVMTYSDGSKYDQDFYRLLSKSRFLPLVSSIRSLEVNTDYCSFSFIMNLARICTGLEFIHAQKEETVGKKTLPIS